MLSRLDLKWIIHMLHDSSKELQDLPFKNYDSQVEDICPCIYLSGTNIRITCRYAVPQISPPLPFLWYHGRFKEEIFIPLLVIQAFHLRVLLETLSEYHLSPGVYCLSFLSVFSLINSTVSVTNFTVSVMSDTLTFLCQTRDYQRIVPSFFCSEYRVLI